MTIVLASTEQQPHSHETSTHSTDTPKLSLPQSSNPGHHTSSIHACCPAERSAFVRFINSTLMQSSLSASQNSKNNNDCFTYTPIDPDSNQIFHAIKDGVLLARLLNATIPGSIQLDKIKTGFRNVKSMPFQMLENQQMVLQAAKNIGLTVVNISAEDLLDGKPYLVFGLLWQIIRAGLFHRINYNHPHLSQFYKDGEDINNTPPEALLLKWFNWHIAKTGFTGTVTNFSADLSNSIAYAHLLHSLSPEIMSLEKLATILQVENLKERATLVMECAKQIDAASYLFLRAEDVTNGREKLNLCFIASLFNSNSGMSQIHEELESRISNLESQLHLEKHASTDLVMSLKAMRERIESLEMENAALKILLSENEQISASISMEKHALEAKFSDTLNLWEEAKKDYENEIMNLKSEANDLSSSLEKSQQDYINEKRQAETFTLCADSLSDELEMFRSRQEKMEYLIEHLKFERMRSDKHSQRLRSIFRSFSSTEQLCRAVYSEDSRDNILSLEKIISNASMSGILTKKARENNNWRVRFFVLRDNFLFYYKSESDPRAEPKGVIRLDDCSVTRVDNPTNTDLKGLHVICVEVMNHGHYKDVISDEKSGKLNFYIAGTQEDLEEWIEKIMIASAWWTRKSSLLKIKEHIMRRDSDNSKVSSIR